MIDSGQEAWWRITRALAVAALGGVVLLGFLLYALARITGEETLLALPADYLLAAAIVPLVLLVVIFWFARRQSEVDRQHDMSED
jgi:putative solute:sodium symporter small subunit